MFTIRIWHIKLLKYLPEAQFKGQLRELVAIMHDWRDKGSTNHLLINIAMEYDKQEFIQYVRKYILLYIERYGSIPKSTKEFGDFCKADGKRGIGKNVYVGWHEKEYLRVCMANLYEKYKFGRGKTRITQQEWDRLLEGYKKITGEDYVI